LSAAKLRFTPAQRLRCKSDFDRVYKDGRRQTDTFFALVVRVNSTSVARLGLSIAAKTVGNAVRRNRVKRLIRESFRSHQHELPPVDVVVNARSASRHATNAKMTDSLEQHWRRIAATCARSSSR
jgi:ribonuclease P protein component